jgi:lysozyme
MARRKKKSYKRFLFLVIAVCFISLAGYFIYQRARFVRAKSTHYPEFGIAIPDGYMIHGIDVSRYQDLIAWEEVQKMKVRNVHISFAFIKATEGISNTDGQFRRNWKKIKQAGLTRGAYHFFIGSKDGKMQAENFIDNVDLEPGDLPPVLDVEQLNGANSAHFRIEVKRWLETATNYYRVKPLIYTNVDFYNHYLGKEFDGYPLWIAHYYQPGEPRIARRWDFWQHSDEGQVNGIIKKVDFNVFIGDSLRFQSLLVK